MVAQAKVVGAQRALRESRLRGGEYWSLWHSDREYQPRDRDLAIFRATMVEQRCQREVATEQGLSQTRVAQIVKQVGAWLGRQSPEQYVGLPLEERLNLAEHLQRERLEHLYRLTLEAWKQSTLPQRSIRTNPTKEGDRERRLIRSCPGQVKFLAQAARIAALDGAGPKSSSTPAQRDKEAREKEIAEPFARWPSALRAVAEPILLELEAEQLAVIARAEEKIKAAQEALERLEEEHEAAERALDEAPEPPKVDCSEEEADAEEQPAFASNAATANPVTVAASANTPVAKSASATLETPSATPTPDPFRPPPGCTRGIYTPEQIAAIAKEEAEYAARRANDPWR